MPGKEADRKQVEQALIVRGLSGDALLDALDNFDSIVEVGGSVDGQGIATLYHATNPENAEAAVKEQAMFGKENGLFFSTHPDGQITGYGIAILQVKIPIEQLLLDDEFGDERHYRVIVAPYKRKPLAISYFVPDDKKSEEKV